MSDMRPHELSCKERHDHRCICSRACVTTNEEHSFKATSQQPDLILLVSLALFVADAQLVRSLSLLYNHYLEASACKPLSILVVVFLRETTVGLLTLQHPSHTVNVHRAFLYAWQSCIALPVSACLQWACDHSAFLALQCDAVGHVDTAHSWHFNVMLKGIPSCR